MLKLYLKQNSWGSWCLLQAGDTGSIPNPERSYMLQSTKPTLSLCSPGSCTCWAHMPWSQCSTVRGAPARSPRTTTKSSPTSATTREKPEQQGRPSTAKNKERNIILKIKFLFLYPWFSQRVNTIVQPGCHHWRKHKFYWTQYVQNIISTYNQHSVQFSR